MMENWAETYDEAIDTLLWVVNDGYTKDNMRESIKEFSKEVRNGTS